jgi:hypothetical protein
MSKRTKEWLSELRGVLKHVKKTSVELKHDTSKIRAERAMRGVSKRKHIPKSKER